MKYRRSIPSLYQDNRHTDRQATAWLHAYLAELVRLAEAALGPEGDRFFPQHWFLSIAVRKTEVVW
jgi:hypothetical protein